MPSRSERVCAECSRPAIRRNSPRPLLAVPRCGAGARSPLCLTQECDCAFGRDFAGPFPADQVRLTSIYSKDDGVVHWQSALVPYGNCVEVTGSHVGPIFNRKTYRVIAATLATPELK